MKLLGTQDNQTLFHIVNSFFIFGARNERKQTDKHSSPPINQRDDLDTGDGYSRIATEWVEGPEAAGVAGVEPLPSTWTDWVELA